MTIIMRHTNPYEYTKTECHFITECHLGRGRKPRGQNPRRQKSKAFNTLDLSKNKLKQRSYIRTKLR